MKKIVRKSLYSFSIILGLLILIVGGGLLGSSHFQNKAILESERIVKEHFNSINENFIEITGHDYSLGYIELGARTNNNSYYATLGVMNPEIIQFTVLNFFIEPKVKIISISIEKNSI